MRDIFDAVHADDVVRLLEIEGEMLMKNPDKIKSEVFNVGGGYQNTTSLLELCEMWDIKPSFAPWRPADQKVFYCDISKE